MTIPVIPVEAVLTGRADAAVMAGAEGSGFLTLSGVDDALGLAGARRRMLSFFSAGEGARARTLRNKYDPDRPNVYRGFFPAEPENDALVEGFDMGPDIADPTRAGDGSDPLTEATPRPGIPGWDEAAGTYHRAMESLGQVLTRILLRGIGVDEGLVDRLFAPSISTLRLFHYPEHGAEVFGRHRVVEVRGRTCYLMTGRHTDFGFVTLLWQDGTGGLQAEGPDGWVDVPPTEGGLVVNFGQMLNDWTGGRIRATPHRVLGGRAERFSVPFFYEPAVDAEIAPLFGEGEPFVYGDFLWDRMVAFPAFRGVVRKPARAA